MKTPGSVGRSANTVDHQKDLAEKDKVFLDLDGRRVLQTKHLLSQKKRKEKEKNISVSIEIRSDGDADQISYSQ